MLVADHGRRVARWLRASDEPEQIAGLVLASSIAADRSALVRAMNDISSSKSTFSDESVDRLLSRPFVERVREGYRLENEFRQQLLINSTEAQQEVMRASSGIFLDEEQHTLGSLEADEYEWYARGRIAFYLAAINPQESASGFLRAFGDVPPSIGADPKGWLADLALKQRPHLREQTRELSFFEAFRAYETQEYTRAAEIFLELISSSQEDLITAVSLHLWAVIEKQSSSAEAKLLKAISLSRKIGASENEMMSRNTLIFRMLAEINAGQDVDDDKVEACLSLATLNYSSAQKHGDSFFLNSTAYALTLIKWLSLSQNPPVEESDADELLGMLVKIRSDSEEDSDTEGVLNAYNFALQILLDQGDFDDALSLAEQAIDDLRRRLPPRNAKKLGQTIGAARARFVQPDQLVRANVFLDDLNRWLSVSR